MKEAACKLRKYNTGAIDSAVFDEHMRKLRKLRKELMPDMAREIPIDPLGLSREAVADWVFPYFIRAGYHSVEHSGGRWARPPRMASMVMPSFAA